MGEPDEVVWLGKNDYKYTFGVCRMGALWHGFARGEINDERAMIFFFSFDGVEDKTEALKKTVAYAFMSEHGYGGISNFVIEFDQRPEIKNARAKDFLCTWGHPLCDGNCESMADDYDFEPNPTAFNFLENLSDLADQDLASAEELCTAKLKKEYSDYLNNHEEYEYWVEMLYKIQTEIKMRQDGEFKPESDKLPELGNCCICESSEKVRNIIMLDLKSPSGKGWGCFQCGLSMEGAFAVVCDNCIENDQGDEIKFAIGGSPGNLERIPIGELHGEHKHDMNKHPGEK